MKNKLLILLGIILISSCGKNDNCNFTGNYEFIVYGETTPYDSIYHIGDTLLLKAQFNKLVYEKKTSQFYNLDKLNIESLLLIYRIDTINSNQQHGVLEYVDLVQDSNYNYNIHSYNSGNTTLFSNILYDSDTCKTSIRIIFKKKGVFVLTYGPFSIENNMDFDGKCNNQDFNLSTRLNNVKDNNINLLKGSPNEHFNTWILQDPENRFYKGCFAYKVID